MSYNKKTTIYTDGACSKNGQSGARGGIGVYCEDHPNLNVSRPLSGNHTNQRAELQAATEGLRMARENNHKNVEIRTDSRYVVEGANNWSNNWQQNGWRNSDGAPVANQDDWKNFVNLRSAAEKDGINVSFKHVPGHSGHHGNEQADKMARDAARRH